MRISYLASANLSNAFDILLALLDTCGNRRDSIWTSRPGRVVLVMPMAEYRGNRPTRAGDASLVDGLALSVISRVSTLPSKRRDRRIEIGTKLLLTAAKSREPFDLDQVKADLQAFRIGLTDIVDHCVPHAAAELGENWVDSSASFTDVSTASARLYGLVKSIGLEWDNLRPRLGSRAILLATMDREDHIIGPAVLSDQLRRRGHSVRLLQNATGPDLAQALGQGAYDGVFLSASSPRTLDFAVKAIKHSRNENSVVPIILGGACLSYIKDVKKTGADLVTSDIDEALDAIAGDDITFKVAE